jgi:hypothetical protein
MENRKTFDLSVNLDKLGAAVKYAVQGKTGRWLDLRMVELENKEYNDFMLVIKVPKEEYQAGVKGEIVGNAKDWASRQGGQAPQQKQPLNSEDLPF